MDRSHLTFRTYTTLGRVLGALPEPVAGAAGRLVGAALYRLRRDHRAQVAANLARVLGGDVDPVLLNRWARRAFDEYARYWVEGARLPATPAAEVLQHILVVDGFEHLAEGMARGGGVVVALPHTGSWEYGGAFLAAIGFPMTAVAERLEPPELFDYFVAQRASMGLTVVPLGEGSGRAVLRTLRDGGLVGLLCDRDLTPGGVPVDFFGEATTMPGGPATLALRTGATLLCAAVYRGPGRDHHAIISGPVDTTRTGDLRGDVARVTQAIADGLASLIRRHPEQWHVFQPLWLADRPEVAAPSGERGAHADREGAA